MKVVSPRKKWPAWLIALLGLAALGWTLIIAAALRSPSAEEIAERAAKAEAEELARAKAETAARKAEKAALAQWKAPLDVEELGRLRGGGGKPEGVDRTGRELEIFRYHVHGWPYADLARYKDDPGAWSFTLSGGLGEGCKPEHWAPSVVLLEREGHLPLSTIWYRFDGGPLSGLIARTTRSDCQWLIATPEYARRRGWRHPR
ncbi:MAG: hypothetical protein DIU78_020415 [Pseudomonadota bacterium]